MKYTANYNLKQPESTDFYNVEDFNENAEIIDIELKNLNDNKVDKVEGKGLSTNDYTTAEKNKLADLTITVGQLRNDIGFMEELTTTNKSSLVNAVNETRSYFIDKGFGDNIKQISGIDLNTLKNNGRYYVTLATNVPDGSNNYGFVDVIKVNDLYLVQEFTTPSNKTYIRTCNSGTWTTWEQLMTLSMFSNKGLGDIIKFLENVSLDNVKDTGFYYVGTSVANKPFDAGFLEVFKRSDNYVLQVSYAYNDGAVYIRVCNGGTWSNWSKLATETSVSNKIGNLSNLNTTNKNNLVSASNEINSKIGNLSSLHTNEKGTIVASINELKDSVEEGTWTPTLIGATSGTVTSYEVRDGWYVKEGKKVTFYCTVQTTSVPSVTGNVMITGLPFVAKFTSGSCVIGFARGIKLTGDLMAEVGTSTSNIIFTELRDDGNWRNIQGSDLTGANAGSVRIKLQGTMLIN